MEWDDQALSFFKHMQGKIRFSHGKIIEVQYRHVWGYKTESKVLKLKTSVTNC